MLNDMLIDLPGALGTAESYRAPLELEYKSVRADTDDQRSDQESILLVVISVSCTIHLERFLPGSYSIWGYFEARSDYSCTVTFVERKLGWSCYEYIYKEVSSKNTAVQRKHKMCYQGKGYSLELQKLPVGVQCCLTAQKVKHREISTTAFK